MFSQVLPTLNIFQTRYLIIIMYILIINTLYSVTIALLHSYNQWLNEKQCNDVIAVKEQWLMDRRACQLAGPD